MQNLFFIKIKLTGTYVYIKILMYDIKKVKELEMFAYIKGTLEIKGNIPN